MSNSSPLAYLRERTCELDIGAFLHCKGSKFGLWYCESWGIGENEKEKAGSTTQRCFLRCCWNCRDVILFTVVQKIIASRENRGELLGDEVMKTASHRNCRLRVALIRIWTASPGQEMGISFYIAKPLCWFQSRSVTSLFCAVQYNSVKDEDSQHFVSRNLRTVGRLLQFTKLQL